MLGIIFLLLGLAATKLTIWQAGFFEIAMGRTPPETDYMIVGLSFTAALIFFALWYASRINKEESKTNILFE